MNEFFKKLRSPKAKMLTAIFLIGLLALATLTPNTGISYYGMDRLIHWMAFFFVALTLSGLLSFEKAMTVMVMTGVAFVLEYGQFFIPGRVAGLGDLAANIFGIFCAIALLQMPIIVRHKRQWKIS